MRNRSGCSYVDRRVEVGGLGTPVFNSNRCIEGALKPKSNSYEQRGSAAYPGRDPLSGVYHGHAEVGDFSSVSWKSPPATFRLQLNRILAESDVMVMLCTESANRDSSSWSLPKAHVWTLRDGYAASYRQYQGDQQT